MKIIKSHLNQDSWDSNGVCFTTREKETIIDTIIVHSAYLSNELLCPKYVDKEADVKNELNKLFTFLQTEEVGKKELDKIIQKIDNFLGIVLKDKFSKENISDTFSVNGIKILFEYLGVSAHYVIARNGDILELVNPKYKAFHAGKSKLPNSNKSHVNEFSIGIEMLSSSDNKILKLQYESLKDLVLKLAEDFPISNIYGHSDIAIPKGRKIDPIGFDWIHFMELLNPMLKNPLNHPST